MRTLSSTLLSAQRSLSQVPYVKVEVSDRVGGIPRLIWERLYTGTEDDFFHAATMPGDGSLLRARVSSGAQLYLQRVANPGPGSNFGSWSTLDPVSSVSGIALASRGANVLLFYVGTDQQTIYVRESTDYGATFGTPSAVVTASSAVGWLATGINSSDVMALLYSVGATIYAIKRTSGTWGPPSSWTNSVASITGLACAYQLDWNVALSGQDSGGNRKVWTCVYGDGYSQSVGSWSALEELTMANSGSGLEFHVPFLAFPGVFRMVFVEKYTGTQGYSRPYWTHAMGTADFISNLWREPVPMDLTSGYGLALAHGGSYVWLSAPWGVWRAANSPASVEITGDVLALTLWAEPLSGGLQIEVRNDDGRYGAIGSGSYAPIKAGSEIRVSPGYRTATRPLVSSGPACWIEGWEYLSQGGKGTFLLHAQDGWGLLEQWAARRQFSWASGSRNVFQLLRFILARVGLELSSLTNSSTLVNHYPAFTIHPGESGAQAVTRLLAMVPDVLYFRGYFAYLKHPLATDPTDYSYGTNHALLEGRYRTDAQGVNRAQVYGKGVFPEGFTWGQVERVYDRLAQVHDLNLDTATKAQERAQAELRRAAMEAQGGVILVPTNCGQELYDVIEVTDPKAGLTAARRRVLGLRLEYSAQGRKPRYEERLELGGV